MADQREDHDGFGNKDNTVLAFNHADSCANSNRYSLLGLVQILPSVPYWFITQPPWTLNTTSMPYVATTQSLFDPVGPKRLLHPIPGREVHRYSSTLHVFYTEKTMSPFISYCFQKIFLLRALHKRFVSISHFRMTLRRVGHVHGSSKNMLSQTQKV